MTLKIASKILISLLAFVVLLTPLAAYFMSHDHCFQQICHKVMTLSFILPILASIAIFSLLYKLESETLLFSQFNSRDIFSPPRA